MVERNSGVSTQLNKQPPLRSLNPYKGKTIREHNNFIYDCEVMFRNSPERFPHDKNKVLYAMQYLEGEPRDRWAAYERSTGADTSTWKEFATYLLDLVQDPVNRTLTMAQRYQDASQRTDQSVHAFASYLETLEAELPPYSDEHRRQHLMSKLRPELRRALTNHQHIPTTYSTLMALAARIEENLKQEKGKKEDRKDNKKDERNPERNKRKWDATRTTTTHTETREKTDLSHITCYNCNKTGHYATSCPEPPKSSGRSKNPRT